MFASSTTDVCTVSGATATTLTVGTCAITATQDGNNIWAPAGPVQRSFTVTKAGQTITFDPPPDSPARTQVRLAATASSELQVLFASSTTDVCTVAGSTATTVKGRHLRHHRHPGREDTWAPTPGTAVIHRDQGGADHRLRPTAGRTSPRARHFVGESNALEAAGLVRLQHHRRVHRSGLDRHHRGPRHLRHHPPTQDGNDTWAPARPVQHSFKVNAAGKKSQTIDFAQPSPAAVGKSVALSASASSGLAVSFTSSTTAVCAAADLTVTTVAPGTCTITAPRAAMLTTHQPGT